METPIQGYTGHKTYIDRSVARLHGILAAITADYKLNDKEIAALYDWLNEHRGLLNLHPFNELKALLDRCLEDQIIDQDEREEILNWCIDYTNEESLKNIVETEAIRRLHGFLQGLMMDGKITENEVVDLQDWLYEYEAFDNVWPFSEVWQILRSILEDSKVDRSEREFLERFCTEFCETVSSGSPRVPDEIYKRGYMRNDAPILKPISVLCQCGEIEFSGNTFCFTGPARSGKRSVLHQSVYEAGGRPVNQVTKSLNYLVIGALSSPCWAYSTYGRKVEQVIKNQENGVPTVILHEDHYIEQVRRELRG